MKRRRVRGSVAVNAYAVVARAVEEGVALGWHRAHKHTDQPSEAVATEAVESAVMEALSEVLRFDREEA